MPPARSTADVTAIIPAYNHAPFLPAAIESVLAQTSAVRRVIVVDDGSTDDTPDIMTRYQDDERVYYVRQKNQGVAASRNHGIQLAETEYVAFLDADDEWLPTKIERQMQAIAAHPDAGLVTADATAFDGSTEWLLPARVHPRDAWLELVARGNVLGATSSAGLMPRTLCVALGGFDTGLSTGADWDMWIRIARKRRIHCIPEPLIRYRYANESMGRNVRALEHDTERILSKVFADPQLPASLRGHRSRVLCHHRVVLAKSYFAKRRIGPGLRVLARSGGTSPARTLHSLVRAGEDTRRLNPRLAGVDGT